MNSTHATHDTNFPYGYNVASPSRLDEQFAEFHLANPEVYQALTALARQAKKAGKPKASIKMLFEVVRWEMFLKTDSCDGYKLNNNLHSRYARLLMTQEPDLAGFFDVRELRS